MGEKVFDNPKSRKDIARLINYFTKEDDLILDFLLVLEPRDILFMTLMRKRVPTDALSLFSCQSVYIQV